jgi:hypothetical protein
VRKLGTAAVPTTASVLLRRKMRRVMDIRRLLALSSWLLASIPMVALWTAVEGLSQRLKAKSYLF